MRVIAGNMNQDTRETRARLEAALALSPVVVFEQDCDLRYLWIHNPALGYQTEGVIGKRDEDLFERPDEAVATEAIKREVLRTGRGCRREMTITWSGIQHRYDLTVEPLRAPNGTVAGVTCIAVDITDRLQAQAELRRSDRRASERAAELQAVLDAVPAAVFITRDRDTRHLEANHFASEMLRIPYGTNVSKNADPEEPPRHFRVVQDGHELPPEQLPVQVTAATGREIRDSEFDILFEDGERRRLLGHVSPLLDAEHCPKGAVGAFIDITERRQVEEALRQSEARLRQILKDATAGTWEWLPAAQQLTWTSEMFELFGLDANDPLDVKRWTAMIWPEDLPGIQAAAMAVFERRTTELRYEYRIVHPTQGIRWIFTVGRAEYADDGSVTRLRGLNLDITDRKRAEEAHLKTEARFRRVFESAATGIAILDEKGKFQEVNPAFAALLGYQADALLGLSFLTRVHPDDFTKAQNQLHRITTGEVAFYEHESRYLRRDGQPVWVHQVVSTLPGPTTPPAMVALVTDITQRREAEAALRNSESEFRAFFHNAAVGAAEVDVHGRFLQVNERLCQITGYTSEELLRLSPLDLTFPADRVLEKPMFADYPHSAHTHFQSEKRCVRKDGTIIWVQVSTALINDTEGRPARSIGIVQEVTDRKAAEAALRRSNELLREADHRKTEFLGVLSHELRNPLASIQNSVQVLEQSPHGSAQATRAKRVLRRQTEHLTHLVDDLLDVTRISHGKITLQRSLVDLRDVVLKAADDQIALFQRSGVALSVALPEGPVRVEADVTRITQILCNLLQNAAKFTPSQGTVRVGTAMSNGHATLYVRDTGIGIEPQQLERMFEPFAQADQSLARTQGGLGLGLALARGLAELHGGTIVAHSHGLGHGAEFIVALPPAKPTATASAPPKTANATAPQPPTSILLIEDNLDVGDSLAELLELQGHQVHIARDGRSGMDMARRLQPSTVLCDIGLPDMSGYDVAQALRQETSLTSTRLIALSGYAQPEDRQHALDAGFDAHVAKPASLEALLKAMA